MKILFIFARPEPYNSLSVREKPCGGTEKAVIFLGEAFQRLGHTVEWLTTPEQIRDYAGKPDVVITQIASLLERFPEARRIWWTHHFSDQPVIVHNAAYGRIYADKVVTLSKCHQADFRDKLKIDSVRIGHGVWYDEINAIPVVKDPYRLIYASTPFRGLEHIPRLFGEIRKQEPRATIAICSSMATYGEPDKDAQYEALFYKLAAMPGVEFKGALNQAELYKEYAKAAIFFYPSIWPETCCCALDEAVAHGCWPVVTPLGALAERTTPVQEADFVGRVLRMFEVSEGIRTDAIWQEMPRGWVDVARQWEGEVLSDS